MAVIILSDEQPTLRFDYVNHEGKIARRVAEPQEVFFGSTPWHTDEQWVMRAFDREKKAIRFFAMKDMTHVE